MLVSSCGGKAALEPTDAGGDRLRIGLRTELLERFRDQP
jgi:hypothetical protein